MAQTNTPFGERGVTIWFTGLSGAGKSTIAREVEQRLKALGKKVEVLDGDVVRTNLSKGLGFSKEDRDTNIRRIGFVSKLLTHNGVISIVAAISPYREVREELRRDIGEFVEVYVECPLDELVRRDVKGLYLKAIRGEIANFTGVSDPYEPPEHPEVVVHTAQEKVEESVARVLAKLAELGYLAEGARVEPPIHSGDGNGHREPGNAGEVALIPPHGGKLVNRYIADTAAEELAKHARELPVLRLDARQLSDAHMIAQGAFSPLEGFMTRGEYLQVVQHMHLPNGLPWPIPVTLSVGADMGSQLHEGNDVALATPEGRLVGVLHLKEIYSYDKHQEARLVYRTQDVAHPGVANLNQQGSLLLGGTITLFELPHPDPELAPFYRTPLQTRQEFAQLGWRTVVGFQTRNPVHRAHEYIQKVAMEIVDGLLLHPLVGETKADDIPATVRMLCYQALLERYYPQERVLLSVYPAFMRYAGPREAVFHALVRKNYGCSHFIVGRDHAGVGNYYGTYDAQHIFREFAPQALGITPLFFENSFYCRRCSGMASAKTCPHSPEVQVNLSGTQVRAMLQRGELPPPEFSRPEVAQVLVDTMAKSRALPS